MREIKFRAKSIKTNEWLYGDLIHNRGKVYIAPIGETYIDLSADDFEVDEDTIGQYTGIDDKDGNEIYEGDILEYWTNKTYNNSSIDVGDGIYNYEQITHLVKAVVIVEFVSGMFGGESEDYYYEDFTPLRDLPFHNIESLKDSIDYDKECNCDSEGLEITEDMIGFKVIGNKYDNKELLED